MAFQQRSIVPKQEMVRSLDYDLHPSLRRQAIVNGLNVGPDLPTLRVGFPAVVAHKKHERPIDPGLNHAPMRSSVYFLVKVVTAPLYAVAFFWVGPGLDVPVLLTAKTVVATTTTRCNSQS